MNDRAPGEARGPGPFFVLASLGTIVITSLIRVRVHSATALPSSEPLRWHLSGVAEDLLACLILALIALAIGKVARSSKLSLSTFIPGILILTVLSLVQSEAVIMFGGVIGPAEIGGGGVMSTIRSSVTLASMVMVAGTVVLVLGLVAIAFRLARGVSGRGSAIAWIVLGCAAAVTAWSLRDVHRGETASNPLFTLTKLLSAKTVDSRGHGAETVDAREPEQSIVSVRSLLGEQQRSFLSDSFPLAYRREPGHAPIERLNVVIIALENLRTEEVGAYGGGIEGLTPNLDRLAREGVRVERAWSAGTKTPMGELALWYGVLPTPGMMLLSDRPDTVLTGLPEILKANGWRSLLWMSSTDQTFYRRDRFYLPRGFQMFDGNSFPPEDPRVNWGVSDRALMKRAADALDRLQEPFAAMVLTVNNHHPYQVPSDAEQPWKGSEAPRFGWSALPGTDQLVGNHASQMIRTIRYTDEAVGLFFELARERSWFERTIFVITGDHGIAVAPLGETIATRHRLGEIRHLVPLIFFSPRVEPGVLAGPASHADVMPTLLGLMGIEVASGLGTDLFDPGAREARRPVFGWSEPDRVLSIALGELVYSCVIGRGGDPIVPGSEQVVDTGVDPAGTESLAAAEPGVLEEFRGWARTYVQVYPWVVESGRSGVPPDGVRAPE